MTHPDEIELEPLDDDDLAELRAIGRNPENFLYEISYAHEIQKLTEEIARWVEAYTRAEKKNPNDPQLPRARKIMAEFHTELDALRHLFLKSWRPDRRHPN